MRLDGRIHETKDGDIAFQMCRCHACGKVRRCTPWNDFYGREGELLTCERCLLRETFGTEVPQVLVVVERPTKWWEN